MKHKTVYVPVKVTDDIPDDGYYFILAFNNNSGTIECACEVYDGDFYMDEDKGYPSNKNKIKSWLKPIENVNTLTDSELLELKKKWEKELMDNLILVEENDWCGQYAEYFKIADKRNLFKQP